MKLNIHFVYNPSDKTSSRDEVFRPWLQKFPDLRWHAVLCDRGYSVSWCCARPWQDLELVTQCVTPLPEWMWVLSYTCLTTVLSLCSVQHPSFCPDTRRWKPLLKALHVTKTLVLFQASFDVTHPCPTPTLLTTPHETWVYIISYHSKPLGAESLMLHILSLTTDIIL